MDRHKAGLHKEVSSIFQGVPIPDSDGTTQPAAAPVAVESPAVSQPASSTEPQPYEQPQIQADAVGAAVAAKLAIPPWLQQLWEQINSRFLAPKPGVDPARQKVMLILIPVLFIVLAVVLFKVLGVAPQRTNKVMASELTAASAGSNTKIAWQIPQPYPAAIRDPMQIGSVASAQAGTGALAIKGIVYSVDNPSAIIGTEVVREGDKISGVTILKINRDSIEFELKDKRWTQQVQR